MTNRCVRSEGHVFTCFLVSASFVFSFLGAMVSTSGFYSTCGLCSHFCSTFVTIFSALMGFPCTSVCACVVYFRYVLSYSYILCGLVERCYVVLAKPFVWELLDICGRVILNFFTHPSGKWPTRLLNTRGIPFAPKIRKIKKNICSRFRIWGFT